MPAVTEELEKYERIRQPEKLAQNGPGAGDNGVQSCGLPRVLYGMPFTFRKPPLATTVSAEVERQLLALSALRSTNK
jgi:hypothetical protein